jgi:hypothetical protein
LIQDEEETPEEDIKPMKRITLAPQQDNKETQSFEDSFEVK